MKVGDLVTVAPAHASMYLLVDTRAYDMGQLLPDCVMLMHPSYGPMPMERGLVRVVSESR